MTSLSGGSVTSWAARAAAAQAIAERLPAAVEEAAGAAQAADDGACDEEGDDDHDEDEPPDEPALANRLKAWKKNRREHLNQTIPKISVHGEMTLIMIQIEWPTKLTMMVSNSPNRVQVGHLQIANKFRSPTKLNNCTSLVIAKQANLQSRVQASFGVFQNSSQSIK